MKRNQPESSTDDTPGVVKKATAINSDSETEFSDSYLDDLERELDEKFGPVRNFESEIFISSPHDTIMHAVMIDTSKIKSVVGNLEQLPDGKELTHFVEFLTGTKA